MGIVDWAADKVQTFTGEKERRQLVEEYKQTYNRFRTSLISAINSINDKIKNFNNLISQLNIFRKEVVGENILLLRDFLGLFGNVKSIGKYAKESDKEIVDLPQKQLEVKEDYIDDIDWSKDEIFTNTFWRGPLGMRSKTRKQNMSIRENLGEFNLEITHTLNMFKLKENDIDMDTEIARLYCFCVKEISEYIMNVIMPELEVVEALLQSITLKNEVVAGNELESLTFNTDLRMLKGTIYEKHYHFVRNVFMFYVISCKIFDTPVLTNLLNGNTSSSDQRELNKQKVLLLDQEVLINDSLMFSRRKNNGR